MKKILFFGMGLFCAFTFAQNNSGNNTNDGYGKVGINTSETDLPKATLDIRPNTTNRQENANSNEGLLVPRVSKTRLSKMSNPQESTIVYVVDEVNEDLGYNTIKSYTGTDQRVAQVFRAGHYIFQNGVWNKMNVSSNTTNLNKTYKCTTDNIGEVLKSTEGYFVCNQDQSHLELHGELFPPA